MKKIRICSVIAMLLAIVLSFTSCAIVGGMDVSDSFIKNASPISSLTIKSGAQISALDDMSFVAGEGNLIQMYNTESDGSTRYYVYSVSKNDFVYNTDFSADAPVKIELHSIYADGVYVDFFTVQKDGQNALYDASGTKITSTAYEIKVMPSARLIYVDEDMYEITEKGISKEFTYSNLSPLPDELVKYRKNYYYVDSDNCVTVYDSKLEVRSVYKAPSYANDVNLIMLKNGNMLVQYNYPSDQSSNDYSYIQNGTKYNLVTEIFKVKSGRVKEIRCNYYLDSVENGLMFEELLSFAGLNVSKFPVSGYGHMINDRVIDETELSVYIKNNGKVRELKKINGETVHVAVIMAKNRWYAITDNHGYLMNNKGKIIGDVTEATPYGEYLVKDGAIYSSNDLSKLYTFDTDLKYIESEIGPALILGSSSSNKYELFTGSSTLTTIISSSSEKLTLVNSHMYGILKDKTLNIFDNSGVSVYSCESKSNVSTVYSTDSYYIIKVTNNSNNTVFHKITLG